MGHSLTGGHSFFQVSGCEMTNLSVGSSTKTAKYQLLVFTKWDFCLQRLAEGQAGKGCCWKTGFGNFLLVSTQYLGVGRLVS